MNGYATVEFGKAKSGVRQAQGLRKRVDFRIKLTKHDFSTAIRFACEQCFYHRIDFAFREIQFGEVHFRIGRCVRFCEVMEGIRKLRHGAP
jgi:hypothetical protein